MDATRADAGRYVAPADAVTNRQRRAGRTLGLFPALGIFTFLMLVLSVHGVIRRAGVYAYVDDRAIEKPMVDLAKELIMHRSGETQPTSVEEQSYHLIALDQAIERELLSREALRLGITVDEKTFEAHRKQLTSRIEAWQPVEDVFEALRVSPAAFEAEIERDVLQQKLKESISKEVRIPTEEEARAYYDRNLEKFKEEAATRVMEIVIGKSDSPHGQIEARGRAEAIRERARAGEDFQHLAATVSEGSSRRAGGDLGFVKRGLLPSSMETAVEALADGEISEVVETRDAFHILKVVGRRSYGYTPFSEVREQILSRLATVEFERRVSELTNRLRAHARIVRFDILPSGR